ncbi:MAG: hypothetical protein AB7V56_03155 [Candidatus Nitrosocosmicus sp.]|jgi:hypothetical protein|uniref:hypothetical protein n=1 Tax=Candidatus Nitrosocosmicus agrestis TaxID=2563600 RepID=UPI00122E8A6E|nr:hypothetical protein [Candidatus Nitrosocosmicus sp. SS]KAA2283183.1 hypothetical protein F1Z66_03635 [Candidatus Nitrosocosmicus sp. SS]KAF0868638.1 hypothetical protein E5N71_09660 [Candidatus Nitrosocosmicus sp. SS]MDR4489977.1 hypothetical protein [Candidatus Nitrosocosmicus sp.]HET6590591.1 hypothetical protein [Candidatus Nitrosocosmicus sp.]
MNKFSAFVVLSVIAAAALMGGAMMAPVFAQDNMTMTMDGNSTMPMDHGNMTMSYDNSTDMASNSTM